MIAFILAGLVFAATLAICVLMVLAAGMSDSPSAAAEVPIVPTFVCGIVLTALIAASHWLPHLGW